MMSSNNSYVKWPLLAAASLAGLYGLRLLYLSLKGVVKYGTEMAPAVYVRSGYLAAYLVMTACLLIFSRMALVRSGRDALLSVAWIVLALIFVAIGLLSLLGIIGTIST